MPSSTTKSLPTPCILVNFNFNGSPAFPASTSAAPDPMRDRERKLGRAPRVVAGGDRPVAAPHRVEECGELGLERITFRVRGALERDSGHRHARGAPIN